MSAIRAVAHALAQDDAELIEHLKRSLDEDPTARIAYDAFRDFEEMSASTSVQRELQRVQHLAAAHAKKQGSQAGRIEKRLDSLQDWTKALLERDNVRRAHVRSSTGRFPTGEQSGLLTHASTGPAGSD